MATPDEEPKPSERDESSDAGTGSDSDSDGDSSDGIQVEWLATSRAKRSTAGNRMKAMLANEEPAEADDDLELLFVEDEDDAGFVDDKNADSDVQMDSSSDDEDQDEGADELEGEKELELQARQKRAAQRKRKAQDAIPAKFRKKVRIEQPETRSATPSSTAPPPPRPRPKKKSERLSWLPAAADLPTRASDRKTTRISKEQLHQKMIQDDVKRKKAAEAMARKQAKLEAMKKPPMTQEERLAEAALVEKRNAKSLNRWEEAEKLREEERLRKIAALHSRKLDGPVVTFYSGNQELEAGQMKHIGKMVSIEEKAPRVPRKKKQQAAAEATEADAGGEKMDDSKPSEAAPAAAPATAPEPTSASEPAPKSELVSVPDPVSASEPASVPEPASAPQPVSLPADAPTLAPASSPTQVTVLKKEDDTGSSTPIVSQAPENFQEVDQVAASEVTQVSSSGDPDLGIQHEASEAPIAATEGSQEPALPAPAEQPDFDQVEEKAIEKAVEKATEESEIPAEQPERLEQSEQLKQSEEPEQPMPSAQLTQPTQPEHPKALAQPAQQTQPSSVTPPIAPPSFGSMAPPSIPNPPDMRSSPSAVLAAPVLAPPLGPNPGMLGAQMPILGFGPPGMKSNVLALPNTSHSGLSPPPLNQYTATPPPAATSPNPPAQPALPSATPAALYTTATLEPVPEAAPPQPAQGKGRRKSAAPKQPEPPVEPEPEPPMEGKVVRSCIILQNFDEEAIKDKQVQTQILFGRKMSRLASESSPPPPFTRSLEGSILTNWRRTCSNCALCHHQPPGKIQGSEDGPAILQCVCVQGDSTANSWRLQIQSPHGHLGWSRDLRRARCTGAISRPNQATNGGESGGCSQWRRRGQKGRQS